MKFLFSLNRIAIYIISALIFLTGCANIDELDQDYLVIDHKTYHVLVDEYLNTNDQNNPDLSILTREYRVYDGSREGNVYSEKDSAALPKEIKTTTQAKEYLREINSDWLKLRSLTIINEKVLGQWKSEGYQGNNEYWNGSPKGLTLEKIIDG